MTEAKHTPGPWTDHAIRDHVTEVCAENGNCIASIEWGSDLTLDEAKANARLIALAPELAEYIASSASAGCATAAALIAKVAVTTGERDNG